MAAIGLFVPQVSRDNGNPFNCLSTGITCTNIRANLRRINYETATFEGT
jgi:hypothetical protein